LNTIVVTSSLSLEPFDVLETGKPEDVKTFFPSSAESLSNSETPLYSMLGGGEFSYLGFAMVCRSDGATMVIPQNVLGNFYFDSFKNRFDPVFSKAIKNLLNIRNHLLLQLDLECGNISEEYFDKEEPKYLTEIEKSSFEKLNEEIRMLLSFTHLPLDSEDISEIFNCSIDDAEKALTNYLIEV
jgi:hypothetical protein